MQPQTVEQDRALELRVQRGPQAGARSPLPAMDDTRGFELHIGGAPGYAPSPAPGTAAGQRSSSHHDLMLHGTSWARLRATPARDGSHIQLELLEGIASVDGRPLPAAMPVPWPMYASLQVADVALAFGSALEPVWHTQSDDHDHDHRHNDAQHNDTQHNDTQHNDTQHDGAQHDEREGPVRSQPNPDAQHVADGAALAAASPHALPWPRWLVIAGASLLAGSMLLFGLVKLSGFGGKPHNVLLVEQALSAKGFTQLKAQPDAAGMLTISGTLPSQADQQALEDLLKRLGAQARLDIRVPDLSDQVKTFFARIGVDGARVENLGGGRIAASTSSPRLGTTEQRDEAVADARREISGLVQLTIDNKLPDVVVATASTCRKTIDDPGKQPTSIVWHPRTPSLNTADGSRYTIGSLLPGGYRLKSIDKDKAVTLECDGRIISFHL